MTAHLKLGTGLFTIVTCLIFTIFVLPQFLSNEDNYEEGFPYQPLVLLGSAYALGVYLVHIATKEFEVDKVKFE